METLSAPPPQFTAGGVLSVELSTLQPVPPSPEVLNHEASLSEQPQPGNVLEQPVIVEELGVKESRFRRIGKAALSAFGVRLAVEGIGIGVDAALLATGISPVAREAIASTVDRLALDRMSPEQQEVTEHEHQNSRIRKLGGKVLTFAGAVGVAIVAQKGGVQAANLIHHGLATHSITGYAVPIASKIAGQVGFNAARRRMRI